MSNWTLKEKSVGDLEVTVSGEEWTKAVKKAFNKIAKNVTIDGFRKGCAPVALIEKRVSEAERYYQAIDDNANTWMRNAMEENNLQPISQPQLDIKSVDAEKAELVFTFAVYPTCEVTDYKGLTYTDVSTRVLKKEIDAELDHMRENYADMETVDGEAQDGDTVNIDYEGFKDGVAFEGGKAEGYNLTLGSKSFIPGFEDQLVGAKAGEEKELNLSFPEDYPAEDLKGAAVVFKVKVNKVERKVLPELNDDFAADVNMKDVTTLEDLKKAVKERLSASKKEQAENAKNNELMDQLAEKTVVEIPDVLVEEEMQSQIQQLQAQISQYGISLTSYLQMMGKTVDDLKNDYHDGAVKNIKLRMALAKIAETENLEVSDEDLETEYKNIADQYQLDVEQVKKSVSPALLKQDVLAEKAMELVKASAVKKNTKEAEEAE